MDYISHVSVSLLRNSNVLNWVYPTHIKEGIPQVLLGLLGYPPLNQSLLFIVVYNGTEIWFQGSAAYQSAVNIRLNK